MFLIAMVGAMTMSLVACDSNINAGNTVPETEINETVDVVAEPQTVNASDLAPIASVISGVEDMKIQENTDIDLNELVYVDDTIVKSVDIDDSNVDYTKAGEYEVVYTIVFDKTAFNEYLDENEIEVNFDTDTESDTIVVTTTLTIEVVTEEVAAEIIDKTINFMNHWYQLTGTINEFYDCNHVKAPSQLNRKGLPFAPYNINVRLQSIRDYGWSCTLLCDLLNSKLK